MIKYFLTLFTALVFTCASKTIAANSPLGSNPNVIIIYTDDLGYGDISCYGATAINTPNIDKIAADGLRFTQAYAAASTCTPSRYAMLTGQYPWRKKGTGVLPGNASMIIDPSQQTLPGIFQAAGYRTGAIGKWHLGLGTGKIDWNSDIRPGPNEVGFDEYFIIPATNDRTPCVYLRNGHVANLDPDDPIQVDYYKKVGDEPTAAEHPEMCKVHSRKGDHHHGTIINGVGRIGYMAGGKTARWNDETMADTLTDEAIRFIDESQDKSFFLYFATVDIHAPRLYHPRFEGKSGLGPRGDMTLQLDYCVGRLLDHLDKSGLTENTLVIFSSDNGPKTEDAYLDGSEKAAELRNHQPAGILRGGKYTPYEGGTRIPFIIRWPGHIQQGVSSAMICQIDLLASFASMLNQPVQRQTVTDSEELLSVLLGKSDAGRTLFIGKGGPLTVRSNNWKLITGSQPQLFDLTNDPSETTNLAKTNPEQAKCLLDMLEKSRRKK